MLAEFDLTGRKALVTGAGRGIGKGIALVLAEAGCDVAVTSFGQENADKVAAEVKATGRQRLRVRGRRHQGRTDAGGRETRPQRPRRPRHPRQLHRRRDPRRRLAGCPGTTAT